MTPRKLKCAIDECGSRSPVCQYRLADGTKMTLCKYHSDFAVMVGGVPVKALRCTGKRKTP